MAAPLEYVRPELFDEAVERHHHSYVSAVLRGPLGTIRCRTTRALMPIRQRWISCAGQAMGPINIPATWQANFLARFANVPRNNRASTPYVTFVNTHRPTCWTWIQQFSIRDSNSYFQCLYAF
jgi:hypothetical protein